MILDAVSTSRATRPGQLGGARDLEYDIVTLTSEVAHHGERESVLYFRGSDCQRNESKNFEFRGSQILAMFAFDIEEHEPPTPLHAVGKWRAPVDPSCSSKVRLVDAAIQSFSATFGLKSGKEQHKAMQMLESLVPPMYSQLARNMGVTTALVEQTPRTKVRVILFGNFCQLFLRLMKPSVCSRKKITQLLQTSLQWCFFAFKLYHYTRRAITFRLD